MAKINLHFVFSRFLKQDFRNIALALVFIYCLFSNKLGLQILAFLIFLAYPILVINDRFKKKYDLPAEDPFPTFDRWIKRVKNFIPSKKFYPGLSPVMKKFDGIFGVVVLVIVIIGWLSIIYYIIFEAAYYLRMN